MSILYYIILFREKSFNDIEVWIKDLRLFANPDIKTFLIGNKIDLENEYNIFYFL